MDALRHELDLADDDLDVTRVGQQIDPSLGTVGSGFGARVSLTLHGVALCKGSEEELDDVLRTMRYAYQGFRANGPGARILSEGLASELKLDPMRLRRTHELVQWLPGIGGGQGTSADSWYREITPDITKFKGITSIAELLAAVPRARRLQGPAAANAGSRELKRPAEVEEGVALTDLHPEIANAAGPLFADGHYAPAAFQAWKAIEVRLRQLTGLDLSGRALAAQALGGTPPPVTVSRHSGRTGDDEQEGLRFIFMGAMQGLRNPGGHELGDLDHQEAMEELALASLLMRWLDKSRVADRPAAAQMPRPARSPQVPAPLKAIRPSSPTEPSPRVVVLAELLEMSHKQARTNVILDLKLRPLGESSGIPLELLQNALVDLLAEGLAEPYAASMDQSAAQGACRITGAGVRELARLRARADA